MKKRKIYSAKDRAEKRAALLERQACKKWMKLVGIPLLRKDMQILESKIKLAREERNATIFLSLEQAAQMAEIVERKQIVDHGEANTGGGALAAKLIRSYASGFKGYQGARR